MSSTSSLASGLTVVLSGATGQIGGQIALQLCQSPKVNKLVLLGRDATKMSALVASLPNNKASAEIVDLSSIDDLLRCSSTLSSRFPKIDVLLNNAACVPQTRIESCDGIEMQFATNVLSYYVLMTQLLANLKGGKVINVASDYAGDLEIKDLFYEKRNYDANEVYRATKQCDRMMSWEAATDRRGFSGANIAVVALMPGVVVSPLLSGLGMTRGRDTASEAAKGPVWLATEAKLDVSSVKGYYHGKSGEKCRWKDNGEKNRALWEKLEETVKPFIDRRNNLKE